MSTPGPKPRSATEHRRAGTFREDRHGRRPPAADLAKPKPPRGLPREELAAWRELVRELEAIGTLHSADVHTIESAAFCIAAIRQARAALKKTGLQVRGDRGAVVAPAFRAAHSAINTLRPLLAELGLTPTARARLGITADEPGLFADLPPSPRHDPAGYRRWLKQNPRVDEVDPRYAEVHVLNPPKEASG